MAPGSLCLKAAMQLSAGTGVPSEGLIGEGFASKLTWLLAGFSSCRIIGRRVWSYLAVSRDTLSCLPHRPLQHAGLPPQKHMSQEGNGIC